MIKNVRDLVLAFTLSNGIHVLHRESVKYDLPNAPEHLFCLQVIRGLLPNRETECGLCGPTARHAAQASWRGTPLDQSPELQ